MQLLVCYHDNSRRDGGPCREYTAARCVCLNSSVIDNVGNTGVGRHKKMVEEREDGNSELWRRSAVGEDGLCAERSLLILL